MSSLRRFTKSFPIRILPEQHDTLQTLAQTRQTSASQLARQAIAEFVAKNVSVNSDYKA